MAVTDIDIVYEDEDLLFIDKPRKIHSATNLLSDGPLDSIEARIKAAWGDYYLLNRLDFYTSGIILVAKNKVTSNTIRQLYQSHLIKKGYIALVESTKRKSTIGKQIDSAGYLYSRYRRSKKVLFSKTPVPRGTLTSCSINPISQLDSNRTVVRVNTNQGHRHIVRCHLATQGTPLWNDETYSQDSRQAKPEIGAQDSLFASKGFFLRAYEVSFTLNDRFYHLKLDWEPHLREYVGPK